MPNNWIPEGGFYEQRSGQGESDYEDAAAFDPPEVPTADMRDDDQGRAGGALSFSDLTKPASYDQGPSQIWGDGPSD